MLDIAVGSYWPPMVATFLASLVEFVEALTVVLAIGVVRGWRPALLGTGVALGTLFAIVLILGPALTRIPLNWVQLVIGTLLLLFGLRWLRKAILRAAGIIPLHNEDAEFAHQKQILGRPSRQKNGGQDWIGIAAAFKIVMLEGIEVVFIVIAVGTAGRMLLPAGIGALAALFAVILLGVALHRPLARVPENTLKFVVGILLSAFGTYWTGEGIGAVWRAGDFTLLLLITCYLVTALLLVPFARLQNARAM